MLDVFSHTDSTVYSVLLVIHYIALMGIEWTVASFVEAWMLSGKNPPLQIGSVQRFRVPSQLTSLVTWLHNGTFLDRLFLWRSHLQASAESVVQLKELKSALEAEPGNNENLVPEIVIEPMVITHVPLHIPAPDSPTPSTDHHENLHNAGNEFDPSIWRGQDAAQSDSDSENDDTSCRLSSNLFIWSRRKWEWKAGDQLKLLIVF